jgi:aspartate/methionine/tyrosine aminotransferase
MQAVQSPIIPIVGELIDSCPGTISLGQGVVYYGPPPEAIEQMAGFFSNLDNHRYQAVTGIGALKAAIHSKLQTDNDIVAGPDRQIVVTAGSNMGFMNAILAITDPGDEVILPVPYYFNHEMAITIASCRAVTVPCDRDYQLRPDAIRDALTNKTRAVVTVSPNNPTGAVFSKESLCEVNDICRTHGLYHISDEAYEYFTYGSARHFSPGSITDANNHTISLYSLSKSYGFASWRIGYMVIPDHLADAIHKIQDTNLICPAVVSQYAALGALRAGPKYCREKIKALYEVRASVVEQLSELGDVCVIPRTDGAFYFMLKVHTELDALAVVTRLIQQHGVAVMPGDTFGMKDGCYLRVAYGALQKETVVEGIGRLLKGLRAICNAV